MIKFVWISQEQVAGRWPSNNELSTNPIEHQLNKEEGSHKLPKTSSPCIDNAFQGDNEDYGRLLGSLPLRILPRSVRAEEARFFCAVSKHRLGILILMDASRRDYHPYSEQTDKCTF
jgi:hypothetical protein